MADYQKENLRSNISQFEMLKKFEPPYKWHFEWKKYAEKMGLIFFSTMEDKQSVDFLVKDLKIPAIKVGSGDLTNYPLLEYTAKFKIPMILSTGLSNLIEIKNTVKVIKKQRNNQIIICQCTTDYPAKFKEINLKAIATIKCAFKNFVGFSDHSLGIECSTAAIALGAKYIEKHFTLDNKLPGPDHIASAEPNTFKEMVKAIRNVEKALGNGIKEISPSSLKNRRVITRKIVAGETIKKGVKITAKNIAFMRCNRGLEIKYYDDIKNRKVIRTVRKNEPIELNLLQ